METARQVAVNLRTALQGVSLRQAHRQTGVDHTTIAAILNGTVWPDLHTLARLEHGLGARLWPHNRHARQPRQNRNARLTAGVNACCPHLNPSACACHEPAAGVAQKR